MKVLVINTGSSSLKYQLISMATGTVLAKGLCDRIGIGKSFLKHFKLNNDHIIIECELKGHTQAIEKVIDVLTDDETGVISNVSEIYAVGHRVVHGGEKFKDSARIDRDVMKAIESCAELAPLHNYANLIGIEACQEVMPDTPMVAVFDTAYHQTMPEEAYIYALPYEFYENYGVRKYGFHGTSHKYVSNRAAQMLEKPLEELKLISCHLGNGASICAIQGGISVDTSMGFTPLQGLAMGTRSGDIDPALVTYLMRKENMSTVEIDEVLNKKSGMLGISGISSDFRDLECSANKGDKKAMLAINIFCYRVKKYIGQYLSVMGDVDAIIFTAGIGENNSMIREKIMHNINREAQIDVQKNLLTKGQETDISSKDSRIRTLVIPTNEELEIARETLELLRNNQVEVNL